MPRPRVKDEDRKRIARACTTCKRRKEKCNGEAPCLLCRRRNRESECEYTDGRDRKSSGRQSVSTNPSSVQLDEALATSNDAEIAIESLLTLSGNRSAPKTPITEPSPGGTASHAPVPKLARLLRDGHGKFIFVGDSSTLAFLQNIRRLAKMAIGECALTTDPKRHAMIEAIPVEHTPSNTQPMFPPKPTRTEAEELVRSYLLASSGIIDLFDQADIIQHMVTWTADLGASNSSTSSIFYLVLAIGAQNRAGANEDLAAFYFRHGRDLAVSSFMDDPSVLTVQSYVLIAFYMLTTCRRNGAFMLLGIAIRAAYALGLHRSDISVLFEVRERKTRERVWKSLRVLDMFMSASLGRPPATSEVDGGNVAWEGTSRGYEDIRLQALHSSAVLRICFIFERVLNEVYCRREVSVQLVNSISRQYRDWNLGLDAGLQTDGLLDGESSQVTGMQQMVGLAHVKGAYYWSIILLTRSFLIFDVSSKLKALKSEEAQSNNIETVTLSEACIDAALRSVEINSDLVHTPGCPRRPVFVTNSVFVSALVLGLAMFGDYDKSFPLLSSLDQAKVVLDALSKYDPAGRRYVLIIGFLQQAALEHIRRRDEEQLKKRRQEIHNIFGDVVNRDATVLSGPDTNNRALSDESSTTGPSDSVARAELHDVSWPQRLEDETSKRGPVLTTSGVLASSTRPGSGNSAEDAGQDAGSKESFNPMSPVNAQMSNIPSVTEEFPLFSLMNEFDAMNDPFLEIL